MPLIFLAVLVVLAAFAAVEAGLLPSPFARVKLIVNDKGVVVAKGSIGTNAKQLIADIVRTNGVVAGFVTVSSGGKVRFSRDIPHRIRQQLRNVILL
jgi:hypothetical protein